MYDNVTAVKDISECHFRGHIIKRVLSVGNGLVIPMGAMWYPLQVRVWCDLLSFHNEICCSFRTKNK